MAPKKMLIRPEKKVGADEKKVAAEAAAEEELQQHYAHLDQLADLSEKNPEKDRQAKACANACNAAPTVEDVDQFLSEAEKNPEKLKASGGGDDSLIADHAAFLKTGVKKLAGKPVSEEENAAFRQQAPSLMGVLKASILKDLSEETPEERAKTAKTLRKMMGHLPSDDVERVLKELHLVDSEEPSESDKGKA